MNNTYVNLIYKKLTISFIVAIFSFSLKEQITNNFFVKSILPTYKIYNNSLEKTLIFFDINPEMLTFNNIDRNLLNKAKIKFTFQIYSSVNSELPLDSGNFFYIIPKNPIKNNFISFFPINTPNKQLYFVKITVVDVFGENKNSQFLVVNKTDKFNSQNYLRTSTFDGKPLFDNYSSIDGYKIVYEIDRCDSLYVGKFVFENNLPKPPNLTQEIKTQKIQPDSIWKVSINDTMFYSNLSNLFYSVDSSFTGGTLALMFSKKYPNYDCAEDMIAPLYYIANTKIYDNLLKSKEPKKDLDSFWLSICDSSIEKAKELIKIYYNRVKFANQKFSTYVEGWKTDRGMLYIIAGAPTFISYSNNNEVWTYGTERKTIKRFVFVKSENKFSDNDLVLIREEAHASFWAYATEMWRKGRPFPIEK